MQRPYRRRDYLTKKWLQGRFALYYLAVLVLGSGALSYFLHQAARIRLRAALFRNHYTFTSTWEILRESVLQTNLITWAIVILAAVLVTVINAWVIERAARRIKENIDAFLEGKKSDTWAAVNEPKEFRHFQQALAEALQEHERKLADLGSSCAELERLLRETREEALARGQAPSLVRLWDLRQRFSALQQRHRHFVLE